MVEKEINGEKVLCEFESVEQIYKNLTYSNNSLYLYKRDLATNEITAVPEFSKLKNIPVIEHVIRTLGYDTHSFDECLELYKDVFESDERYLPFDNDELYITKYDLYEGCCTKDGFEFTTKEYHYFYIIKREEY